MKLNLKHVTAHNSLSRKSRGLWLAVLMALPVVGAAQTLTEDQKARLDELDGLLRENPELIESVADSVKRYLKTEQDTRSRLEAQASWLSDERHPVLGNPDGKRQLVVFNDYNCPFCKRLEPVLEEAIEDYPDLKVVNIFLPLRQQMVSGLNTNSARYGMQVWLDRPDVFAQVHEALMSKSGMHTAASLKKVAADTGTEKQLERSAQLGEREQENYEVFTELGLRGTPSLVIGGEVLPGFVPYERLKPLLDDAL